MIKFKFYIYKEIFHNNYFKLLFISFTLVWKLQQNRRVFNGNLCYCFAESRWSLISQMFFLPTILKIQYFKWAPRCSKISFYYQEGKSDAFFYFDYLRKFYSHWFEWRIRHSFVIQLVVLRIHGYYQIQGKRNWAIGM